jgi:ubiquinone/menaquinone biosynthesis C-methylase UbiE
MLNQFKDTYDLRWHRSINTSDDDILALDNPDTQVKFFYFHYNSLIAKYISEHFSQTEGLSLIEIGCGRATSSIFQALKLGVSVQPTDYSEAALDIAYKNLKKYGVKAEPKIADVYQLPFGDASFNIVISLGVMEHIVDPIRAYSEMYRVLKPGGLMISMNVPEHENIQKIAERTNRMLGYFEHWIFRKSSRPWLDRKTRSKTDNVYRSSGYAEDFMEYLSQAGFSRVRGIEANPFPTFSPVPRVIDRWLAMFYSLILRLRAFSRPLQHPFFSTRENSRCHFVVGYKN